MLKLKLNRRSVMMLAMHLEKRLLDHGMCEGCDIDAETIAYYIAEFSRDQMHLEVDQIFAEITNDRKEW